MALNYRRPSHQLWQSAKQTYEDKSTYDVFDLEWVAKNYTSTELQSKLTKYKLALQPTRHTANWQTIASAIIHEWQSIEGLLKYSDYDFLILKDIVQKKYKKSFPYLSDPKLFNFWCYILTGYCQVTFINQRHIGIAVDSHVKKASLLLGVISEQQYHNLPTDQIATRWREVLGGSPLLPTDLNLPLWYWSRQNFQFHDNIRLATRPAQKSNEK